MFATMQDGVDKSLYPEGYSSGSDEDDEQNTSVEETVPFNIDVPSFEIIRFSRQYLQRLNHEHITYPAASKLKELAVQDLILEVIRRPMDPGIDKIHAYNWNDKRVFKRLSEILQEVARDSDVNNELAEFLSSVVSQADFPLFEAAHKPLKIQYIMPALPDIPHWEDRPIVLYERPSLLTSGPRNGYRTWEAALFLCDNFLIKKNLQKFLKHRNVLELGTGTGILALTCVRYMLPDHFFATDADPEVLERLNAAVKHNFRDYERAAITCKEYQWGESLDEAFDGKLPRIDTVVAADILYDPSIIPIVIKTIDMLFARNPETVVFISSTVRDPELQNLFVEKILEKKWGRSVKPSVPKPYSQQGGYFYDTMTATINLMMITKSKEFLREVKRSKN